MKNEMKSNLNPQEEKQCVDTVEAQRITLVDQHDVEYEFIILDEFSCEEKDYLALVSCDEKDEQASANDPGETNDITVVRKIVQGDGFALVAVTEAQELLAVSRVIEARFGHLGGEEA